MRVSWAGIIISFFLFQSCNKTTTKENTPDKTVNVEKLNATVYPHEKDFYKKHGESYLVNKDQCLSCHGVDGSGGTANVSCTQCHQGGFPHPKNWVTADQHSIHFSKSPQSCAQCHGNDWKGGKSKVSCFQCHEGYPHSLKWSLAENHGKHFVSLTDKAQCLNCHQSNKTTANATRCDSCHKAYPHEKGFDMGNKRHKTLAESYEGKCLNCHQDYKVNMPNLQNESEGVGCFNCHEGVTKIKWLSAEEAQKSSMKRSDSKRLPSNSPHKKREKSEKN